MKDKKTLKREAAASKILFSKYPAHPPQDSGYWKDMFIEGAKWQAERNYSKEDVKNAFLDGWQLRDGDLPFPKAKKKWFNEFKNK